MTVEAEGRSETEAGAKALKALDVQRAIWNLALLQLRAPGPGGSRPLNHVLPGPVQSLHRAEITFGKSADRRRPPRRLRTAHAGTCRGGVNDAATPTLHVWSSLTSLTQQKRQAAVFQCTLSVSAVPSGYLFSSFAMSA